MTNAQGILHRADAPGDVLESGAGMGQWQEVVSVASGDTDEAEVIADPADPAAVAQAHQIADIADIGAIEGIGGTDRERDPGHDDGMPGREFVEDSSGLPADSR